MKIIKTIESWSVTISVLLIIIVWYLLMRFVFLSVEARIVSVFWYSYFIAIAIWAIFARAITKNKEKVKNYFKKNYPQSKPFEFLFFVFLFISTGCLSFLVIFIEDNVTLIINNSLYIFMLVFFYTGAIVFGWFHYLKRIEG